MTILLNQVNANTVSDTINSNGGKAVVFVRGDNFGSGTVDIEVAAGSDPSSRYTVLTDASFTENGQKTLDYLPAGTKLRANLSGATGASNVFVEINQ